MRACSCCLCPPLAPTCNAVFPDGRVNADCGLPAALEWLFAETLWGWRRRNLPLGGCVFASSRYLVVLPARIKGWGFSMTSLIFGLQVCPMISLTWALSTMIPKAHYQLADQSLHKLFGLRETKRLEPGVERNGAMLGRSYFQNPWIGFKVACLPVSIMTTHPTVQLLTNK